jgi:hypothetical protein
MLIKLHCDLHAMIKLLTHWRKVNDLHVILAYYNFYFGIECVIFVHTKRNYEIAQDTPKLLNKKH